MLSQLNDRNREIMSLFLRVPLKDYYRCLRAILKDSTVSRTVLDRCAQSLKNKVFVNPTTMLYCFDKNNSSPIEDCTVGELLQTAYNCFAHRCDIVGTTMTQKNTLDDAGARIITTVLVMPMYCLDRELVFGVPELRAGEGEDTKQPDTAVQPRVSEE